MDQNVPKMTIMQSKQFLDFDRTPTLYLCIRLSHKFTNCTITLLFNDKNILNIFLEKGMKINIGTDQKNRQIQKLSTDQKSIPSFLVNEETLTNGEDGKFMLSGRVEKFFFS